MALKLKPKRQRKGSVVPMSKSGWREFDGMDDYVSFQSERLNMQQEVERDDRSLDGNANGRHVVELVCLAIFCIAMVAFIGWLT